MLIWVTALHCEAKPIIDYYRLRKSPGDGAFESYRGDDMVCVISGIGKIASAAATAWIAARHADENTLAWINLGIAGAAEHDLGSAFMLNQIRDADSGQCYYPAPGAGSVFDGSACLTLSNPSTAYLDNCLFDQEASGFIYAALRFSSAELTQSIKIVSDNHSRKIGKKPARVSALIHDQIEKIDQQRARLQALDEELANLQISPESWRQLISMAHFTQTQQSRLRVLWRFLSNNRVSDQSLLRQLTEHDSAAQILQTLEKMRVRHSANL